jgi:hypothetical protein
VIAVVVRRISELPEIERRGREIESSNRLSGGGFNINKTSFFVCFPLFRKKKYWMGSPGRCPGKPGGGIAPAVSQSQKIN